MPNLNRTLLRQASEDELGMLEEAWLEGAAAAHRAWPRLRHSLCGEPTHRLERGGRSIRAARRRHAKYHTHYGPRLEANSAKGAELYLLTVQLRGIIEMSLLRELGFPCEAIDTILDRVRYREVEHLKAIASAERGTS
jgi:Apea-like HEPN